MELCSSLNQQPMKFFEWQLVRCRVCCEFKCCVGQVDAEKLAQRSSVAIG